MQEDTRKGGKQSTAISVMVGFNNPAPLADLIMSCDAEDTSKCNTPRSKGIFGSFSGKKRRPPPNMATLMQQGGGTLLDQAVDTLAKHSAGGVAGSGSHDAWATGTQREKNSHKDLPGHSLEGHPAVGAAQFCPRSSFDTVHQTQTSVGVWHKNEAAAHNGVVLSDEPVLQRVREPSSAASVLGIERGASLAKTSLDMHALSQPQSLTMSEGACASHDLPSHDLRQSIQQKQDCISVHSNMPRIANASSQAHTQSGSTNCAPQRFRASDSSWKISETSDKMNASDWRGLRLRSESSASEEAKSSSGTDLTKIGMEHEDKGDTIEWRCTKRKKIGLHRKCHSQLLIAPDGLVWMQVCVLLSVHSLSFPIDMSLMFLWSGDMHLCAHAYLYVCVLMPFLTSLH